MELEEDSSVDVHRHGLNKVEEEEKENHDTTVGMTWDEMIEKSLGNFGWKQFVQCVLVSVAMYFDAQQSFISIYSDAFPTWHCTNHTQCTAHSDICNIPKSSWSWDEHSSQSIISQWNLQCANSFITGLPQSSFFIGCLFGSFLLAALADSSLGRKNMLVLSCFFMSLSSILIIFSTNVWLYSALKFLTGFWRSSIGTCVLVLLTEKVSAEWRFTVGIVEFLCFTMGYMSLPLIAFLNRFSSWKSLYLWTSIPTFCYSIIAYLFVTESPRWLLMQGRHKEAFKLLQSVSSSSSQQNFSSAPVPIAAISNNKEKSLWSSFFELYASIGELFKKRWAMVRMVAVMVLGIGIGTVYFGMPLAVGNLGFNIYLAVVFTASMEIPSCVATYFLENYRRKVSIVVFSVMGGICCVMCVVIGNRLPVLKVAVSMAAFFGACTAYNVFLVYIIELFPTCVRNTTTSLVRQAIVFGCIFCPFLISAGRKNNIFSYGVFGIAIILSNLTLAYLPETKGIVLCDTMDQQEKKETSLSSIGNSNRINNV